MRLRSSVARQVFLLQVLIVLTVVVAAVVLAYLDARRTQREDARTRSVAVALAVADAPSVVRALKLSEPSSVIQPYAERVRKDTGTDFVVVMALDRTRYSHPDPSQIGKKFVGDLGGAPEGEVFSQQFTGTLGPSMRAVVPVYDEGDVVAMVSVGITVEKIEDALRDRLWPISLAALLLLAFGAAGAWLISRRLRRQTHGMGEQEITRMYEYYDSVLHAVREGLLLLDQAGRVQLVNDEGRRLLGLSSVVGEPLSSLGLPDSLTDALARGAEPDEIHLVGDRVLVVNQAPATWEGRTLGSVVTLRDHTELRAVSGELDTVRGLAETLRSQNHEAANRLHTVVSLIELGRGEEAIVFATSALEAAQLLADQVTDSVADPVVAALLLGKTAQAAERGIDLDISPETSVVDLFVGGADVVTLIGNLVDNAFDAVAESAVRKVSVEVVCDASGLRIDVADSGPGLTPGTEAQVFERGWSTKRGDAALGRGLGLALVVQVTRRYDGTVISSRSALGGAAFRVKIPR
ncbi:MAG TPA: sensor histidine kinase [Nocardioidaceae bacterium]|nr:sensor histidine kinase [Nocardioidaceae bacterium]